MTDSQSDNSRLVLLLIVGIPLAVILAATALWYMASRGDVDLLNALGTANRGTLIQPPRQIDGVALSDAAGAPSPYASLEPRWSLLVPGGDTCGAVCEHRLWLTRQIHMAMGKDMDRLRRLYVSATAPDATRLTVDRLSDDRPPPPDFATLLASEYRGLVALRMAQGGTEMLFPEWRTDPDTWYLVDPRGWIMMSYNSEDSYKEVIADLKFLLKNSRG
ncbi:MAG: hypothetical protein U5K56_10375 [Halioglobus sp.]|nr:hypothetical protein [Halioglobus sp.]